MEELIFSILNLLTIKEDKEQLLDCLKIILQQTKIEFIENDISSKNIRISKLFYDFIKQNFYHLPEICVNFSFVFIKNLFFVFSQNLTKNNIKIHNE